MRKILSILLILGFVAGGVFAADLGDGLKITGEVVTGISVVSTKDVTKDGSTAVSLWHDDGGNARARLNFVWESDVGGFNVRLQGIPGTAGGANVTIPFGFGWANLFNNKARVVAGKIDSNVWGLGNLSTNAFDPNLDAVGGARIEVKPIDGLNFGIALPLPDGASVKSDFSFPQVGADLSKYFSIVFGGIYESPVFEIAASARTYPKTDATDQKLNWKWDNDTGTYMADDPTPAAPEKDAYVDLIAGVGVPLTDLGLNIALDFRMVSGKYGYIKVGPKVAFTKDALSVNGKVIFEANNEKGTVLLGDKSWKTDQEKIDAKASALAFELGAEYKITPIITGKFYLGSNNLLYLPGNGVWVKPQGTFALGPNTEINVFDKIGFIGADKKKGGGDIYNQFQVNFTWKF